MNLVDDFSDPRFSGVERLLGRAAFQRLRRARACVIGIGGVGGWAAEALARSGIGGLTLVDMDEICVTNINRQVHAHAGTVGQTKIQAMVERLRLIAPDLELREVFQFFTEATADAILDSRPDVVVDCIDSISHKCLLLSECVKRGLRVVTVGGAGGLSDPTRVRVADLTRAENDALLFWVRKRLRQKFGFPRENRSAWGIPAVYSPESPRYPHADGSVCSEPEEGSNLRLDCASGYGTISYVTGAFGFAAAHAAIDVLTGAALFVQEKNAKKQQGVAGGDGTADFNLLHDGIAVINK
jgi:tRNA A37 threonylcarbamoyladenosine dehydratase